MGTVEAVGIVATVVAVGGLVPQTRRLRRTGDCAGLCLAWPLLGLVTESGWVVYTIEQELWLALPAAAAMVVFNLALTVLIARRAGTATPVLALAMAAAWAGVLVIVAATAGWSTLGVVLGGSYAVQVAPLLWSAYRTPTPSGISPVTWAAAVVEWALWWSYGIATDDAGIIVAAIVGLTASLALVGRWYVTQLRRPAPLTPPPLSSAPAPLVAPVP